MQCAGLVETAGLWQEMSLLTLQLSSFAPELLHPLRLLSQRPLPCSGGLAHEWEASHVGADVKGPVALISEAITG